MVAKLSGTAGLEVPVPVAQTQGGTGEVASNIIVQSVRVDDGAVATGAIVIPLDDTIPQITEGDEYMTVAITPKNANNKLIIEVQAFFSPNTTAWVMSCLFQDAISNALKVSALYQSTSGGGVMLSLSHEMVAGTTSAITFRFRAGRDTAGTLTFNGTIGAGRFGGAANSYIKVTEVTP